MNLAYLVDLPTICLLGRFAYFEQRRLLMSREMFLDLQRTLVCFFDNENHLMFIN